MRRYSDIWPLIKGIVTRKANRAINALPTWSSKLLGILLGIGFIYILILKYWYTSERLCANALETTPTLCGWYSEKHICLRSSSEEHTIRHFPKFRLERFEPPFVNVKARTLVCPDSVQIRKRASKIIVSSSKSHAIVLEKDDAFCIQDILDIRDGEYHCVIN